MDRGRPGVGGGRPVTARAGASGPAETSGPSGAGASGSVRTVTALFPDRDATEAAVASVLRSGMPRDRVDVAVTPAVAEREFGGVRPAAQNRALVAAAVGGLIGLLGGSVVALVLVWLPGFHDAGVLAFAQLLGPNLATLGGAVIGAAIGYFLHRPPAPHHARLDEAPGAVLVTVEARSGEEAELMVRLLSDAGGDARIEPAG